MKCFDEYFLMDEDSAVEYVKQKTALFEKDEVLQCKEIGDGNLNYVYRISAGANSVIVKQAGPQSRLNAGKRISKNRNQREAEVLKFQDKLVPGFVPQVYLYDETMCCCLMEDLSDYEIMRTGLLQGKTYSGFAQSITTFLITMFLKTSDISNNHEEKKRLTGQFLNPDLCEISERLVFDEALFNLSGRNFVEDENELFVQEQVYLDQALILEAGKLKMNFMNGSQSLLHGDLHTGSLFVRQDAVRVFDPEFAFYGPAGYDLGSLIAHLIMAGEHAGRSGFTDCRRWICETVAEIVILYKEKYMAWYEEYASDVFARQDDMKVWILNGILSDAAGYAGLEILRRVIGVARIKDIASIEDRTARAAAERHLICMAKRLVMERELFTDSGLYEELLKR